MNHRKNSLILKALSVVLFIVVFNSIGFSWSIANTSDVIFPPGGKIASVSIGDYIVNGASYFLESYSDTIMFMKKIELSGNSGLNVDESSKLLDQAIANIKLAEGAYSSLTKETESLLYNSSVIEFLKKFDYDAFQVEISADKDIFVDVREYLYNGDVKGVYKKMLANTEQIAGILGRIKEKLNGGVTAVISDTYAVNQTFSRSFLFGQYVAQVFGRMQGYN
jgi:hypothetical protein